MQHAIMAAIEEVSDHTLFKSILWHQERLRTLLGQDQSDSQVWHATAYHREHMLYCKQDLEARKQIHLARLQTERAWGKYTHHRETFDPHVVLDPVATRTEMAELFELSGSFAAFEQARVRQEASRFDALSDDGKLEELALRNARLLLEVRVRSPGPLPPGGGRFGCFCCTAEPLAVCPSDFDALFL